MTKTKTDASLLTRPLAGIRIIEFSTMITASLASMLLAQQGADVVKVEPAGTGDPMRHMGSAKSGISALFNNCNRGKRSFATDLKTEAGREAVRELIARADVVIHNFRPGVMDKLGLGSEEMRKINPRLIYLGISGFGLQGPLSKQPAYDHVVQGLSGFTNQQGIGEDRAFIRMGVCDKTTSYTAAQAITAALFARERNGGQGQHIDVSMLHSCLAFLWPDGMMDNTLLDADATSQAPIADYYQVINASDGAVAWSAVQPAAWKGLLKTVGREDLLDDPRIKDVSSIFSNIVSLMAVIRNSPTKKSSAQVISELSALDIPCAPCLDHEEVISHEQVSANAIVEIEDHPIMGQMRVVRHPSQFSGMPGPKIGPSPALGQHNEEIMLEINLAEERGRDAR